MRYTPIVALTCVNAERTLLSRNDTPPDLAFFAPYAELRGVESCSSSSPPAGRPASRYWVLGGSLAGRRRGRHANGALQRELAGIPGTCRGCAFFRWRAIAACAAKTCMTGLGLITRGYSGASPTTKKPKAGGPPGISWLTGGTERHETTDGPPSPPPGRRRSVYDTTVLRPFGARDSSAITQRDPHPEEPGTLATGRTLPAGAGQP